jgi:hypothetical protein
VSSSDEWELMTITEDLEPGDYVSVASANFKKAKMMIVRSDRSSVYLKDQNGEVHSFSRTDLSNRNNWYIVGRA